MKQGELLGQGATRKTLLAHKVLQELNADGRVTRKTQLDMDDVARKSETPS